MKRYAKILLLFTALAAASCVKEPETSLPNSQGEVTVRFNVTLPAPDGTRSAGTRALSETDENSIGDIDVLAFYKDDQGDFRYGYTATNIRRSPSTDPLTVTATVKGYSVEQQFVVLVNATAYFPSLVQHAKMSDVLGKIVCAEGSGEWPARNNGTGPFTAIPMYAKTAALVVDADGKQIGTYPLIRMVARIDIKIKSDVANFKLVSAQLFNHKTAGYVAYDFSDFRYDANAVGSKDCAHIAAVPSANTNTGDPILAGTVAYAADYTDDAKGEIVRSIYTYESPAYGEAGKLTGTAIVIGAEYNGTLGYYRVNLKTTDDADASHLSSHILRNHLYHVEIQSVGGTGAQTPEDAYIGQKPIGVTVKVIDWGNANNGVPLGWTEAEPTANSYMVAPGKTIWIPVFGQVQQAMDAGHLAFDWITNDMNLGACLVWCDNLDVNGVVKTASLTLKKGSSSTFTQIGFATGSKTGNAVVAVYQDKNTNGVYDAVTDEIKWSWHIWVTNYTPTLVYELDVAEDGAVGSDTENNKVYVYTSTGTASATAPHSGTTNVFMDRNLGALVNTVTTSNLYSQMGLLYQWGRKDPFIGTATTAFNTFTLATLYNASGTTAIGSISDGSLEGMTRNPLSYSTTNAGSIVASSTDSWGGATSGQEGSKSIYDPCPEGWRLPKNGAWDGINNNFTVNSVVPRNFYSSSLGYYPLTGYLSSSTVGAQGGARGYSWTAGANGANGYQFIYYFQSSVSYATPSTTAAKTWGCTVRCIQDNYVYSVKPFVKTDADYAYWPAVADPITITVTSNTKWIASVKRSSNVVTWGEASALGQPLISQFNGGDVNSYVSDGQNNTETTKTITITPVEYIDPFMEMEGDLTIVFHDANTGALLNEASITLGSGEIQHDANNCYVVKPRGQGGRAILIPIYSQVSRALPQLGATWMTTDMLTASSGTDLLEPVFVWTDRRGKQSGLGMAKDATVANVRVIRKRGSLQDAYLFVAIGTGEGNTVVGVMNAGLIKWSWHIWVHPDRDVIMAGDYSTGLAPATNWMDRNLGAYQKNWTSVVKGDPCTGMYYQWGRKDPYRGVIGYNANGVKFVYNSLTGASSLARSVNNPGYFLSNTNGSNGSLSWDNGANDYKTPYDPCPKGWRVPRRGSWGANAEWSNIGGSMFQWNTTGQVYPCTGTVNDWNNFPLGSHGRYWSANISGGIGCSLNLVGAGLNTDGVSSNIVNASSIRCIKDPYYTGN